MVRALWGQPLPTSLLGPPAVVLAGRAVATAVIAAAIAAATAAFPRRCWPPALESGAAALPLLPQALLSSAEPSANMHVSESMILGIAMQP